MRNLILLLLFAIAITSCEGPKYVVASGFYALNQGLSENEFLKWKQPFNQYVGGRPHDVKLFDYNGATWKVYVYNIYAQSGYDFYIDHHEYVAFKDGLLFEYGTGDLPLTIRQNPTQYHAHH